MDYPRAAEFRFSDWIHTFTFKNWFCYFTFSLKFPISHLANLCSSWLFHTKILSFVFTCIFNSKNCPFMLFGWTFKWAIVNCWKTILYAYFAMFYLNLCYGPWSLYSTVTCFCLYCNAMLQIWRKQKFSKNRKKLRMLTCNFYNFSSFNFLEGNTTRLPACPLPLCLWIGPPQKKLIWRSWYQLGEKYSDFYGINF